MRARFALALATASLPLAGCVAAVAPLIAAGAIGGKEVLSDGSPAITENAAPVSDKDPRKANRWRAKEEKARLKAEAKAAKEAARAKPDVPFIAPQAAPIAPPSALPAAVPSGMQYLYGSGEAAAVSLQAYLQLMNYLLAVSSDGSVGHPVQSVVLQPGTTLAEGKFVPCGKKPLAVLLDIDETAVLNTGFEADQIARGGAYDQQVWNQWEQTGSGTNVEAVPGAVSAINVARRAGIAVVFNSNRLATYAPQTAALLAAAGFGPVVHGETLWLQGDAGPGSGKDARRAAISAKYCVVAMVGDQLGDFSDQFNAPDATIATRRQLIASRAVMTLWGHGWFILPNPVYGTGLKGGLDEVFPPARRWTAPPTPPIPVETK